MKNIGIYESSILTSLNAYRVVMIYNKFDNDGKIEQIPVGNCFVAKSNTAVPKFIYDTDVDKYTEQIDSICMY